MWLPDCPECERPANAEHFAVIPCKTKPEQFVTYVFCDHCNVGYQSLWGRNGWGRLLVDSSIRYDGPKLPAFLKILESLLCVRA